MSDPTWLNLLSIIETVTCEQTLDVTAATTFDELDIDSLDHARLISACEEAFELDLPQEAHATADVGALYQIILAEQSDPVPAS